MQATLDQPTTGELSKKAKPQKDLVHVVKAKSQESVNEFIGRFSLSGDLRGFSIVVTPSTAPEGSVLTSISRIGDVNNTKFFINVINNGPRAITAKIYKVA